jgi:hypothetical protein
VSVLPTGQCDGSPLPPRTDLGGRAIFTEVSCRSVGPASFVDWA